MNDRELMQQALDAMEAAIKAGDWEVDGACDPDWVLNALRVRLANEFNPDWDAMAVMVEEQQRMAKRIEELEAVLAQPEEPDWSAAGFSKPPVRSEQWWRHEVSNAWAEGYEKGRASVKQPEQEPVAWADKYDIERDGHDFWVSRQQPAKNGVPLYTAPPQREWQGLTDEEVSEILDDVIGFNSCFGPETDFARAIEAKLKEKNNAV